MELDSAVEIISRWSSTSDNKFYVFGGKRDEIDQYLHAVDEAQRSSDSGTAYDRSRAKSAIQIAMLRLADETRNLLKVNGKSTRNAESSTYSSTMTDSASNSYEDDYVYGNALSLEVIGDLRSIALRMNGAGYLRHCKKAYISERKHSIGATYQRLNIQKLSSNDARTMEWNKLELIINVWIKSAKICFRKIFAYEKQLCEKIFGDLRERDDTDSGTDVACFLETVYDYAIQLIDIAKSLSCIRTASDRLFGILKVYKTLFDLLPEMNKLFNTQSSQSFRTKADQILSELGKSATMTMAKFEKDLLYADLSRHDKIRDLSKYVMVYVFKLCQNKQTLMKLSLSTTPSTSTSGAGMDLEIVKAQQPNKLPFHVIWIIMCLVSKLEGEAKSYKNPSDANFFLLNNLYYIVQKINRKQEVKEMVGDTSYLEKISGKYEQAKAEYLRLTFAKVLSILGDNRYSLPAKLKRFNAEFKKLQANLAALSVADFQLLKDLRASMEEMLVPAYTLFLGQLSTSPLVAKDVKFSAEEIKTAIYSRFLSKTVSNPKG